ncbi:MAG: hypothetical protein KBE91_11460 [Bacteroidia bacterium]|nr:hypothetical protein [Bacteroidia bacterium]
MKKYFIFYLLVVIIHSTGKGQVGDPLLKDTLLKATQYSIPSSGAFTLLGVNPENVSTPGFSRDFKIDYFFQDAQLNPNIALQCQPFWLLFYKNKTIDSWIDANFLHSIVANTEFSFGSTQTQTKGNQFAYSFKTTIGYNPLTDINFSQGYETVLGATVDNINQLNMSLTMEKIAIQFKLDTLESKVFNLKTELSKLSNYQTNEKNKLINEINTINAQITERTTRIFIINSTIEDNLNNENKTLEENAKKYVSNYMESKKSKFRMDIGFGQVFQYKDTLVTELNPLLTGFGIWINPGFGFCLDKNKSGCNNSLLFAAIGKMTVIDTITEITSGFNIRYVGGKTDVFTEYSPVFSGQQLTANRISFGGGYELDKQKYLQIGFLMDFDQKFKLTKIQPTFMVNLELGRDVFNTKK